MELEAFKKTVLPLREKLLAYATRLIGNSDDAEDVVQDVFLKLWSIREKLDKYRNIDALAMEIAKNKSLDELKKRRENLTDLETLNVPSCTDNPAETMELKDAVRHIRMLIERLPSLQQSIIRMKDVEDYEISEIAEITGTQIEAVRVNLSRARKKIREQAMRINSINNKINL